MSRSFRTQWIAIGMIMATGKLKTTGLRVSGMSRKGTRLMIRICKQMNPNELIAVFLCFSSNRFDNFFYKICMRSWRRHLPQVHHRFILQLRGCVPRNWTCSRWPNHAAGKIAAISHLPFDVFKKRLFPNPIRRNPLMMQIFWNIFISAAQSQ